MNFFITIIVCAISIGVQEDKLTYDITDIRNIMGAWTVDADENVFIKFKTSYIDESGKVSESNQTEITHVLFEGNISVQRPQEGSVGITTTWIDDTAILYVASTSISWDRMYSLDKYLDPGDMASEGFAFTGFIGLDTNIQMLDYTYPSIANQISSVTVEGDEISLVVVPIGGDIDQSYRVYVIGTHDQRFRRVEVWIKRHGKDAEPTLILTSTYSNWKLINGKERPTTMFRSSSEYGTGTLFEIVEIRPATKDDLGVIPPNSRGASIWDNRIRFACRIGDTSFSLDGYYYKTTIPITGPPLNLEAVLAASSYAGGKPPQLSKPREYLPNDTPQPISLLGELVTFDIGEFDRATGEREVTILVHFLNPTDKDISITGWNNAYSIAQVTPQEAVISPGEQLEVEVTITLRCCGDRAPILQPILEQKEEASKVQLTYKVVSSYSTHVLNSIVRIDEHQKGTLNLICISSLPPDSVVSYSASDGIEGKFSGWVEVNPEDLSPDCLGKLWQSTVEVTGTAVDDSWILIRTEKRSLGLFPVLSDQ